MILSERDKMVLGMEIIQHEKDIQRATMDADRYREEFEARIALIRQTISYKQDLLGITPDPEIEIDTIEKRKPGRPKKL